MTEALFVQIFFVGALVLFGGAAWRWRVLSPAATAEAVPPVEGGTPAPVPAPPPPLPLPQGDLAALNPGYDETGPYAPPLSTYTGEQPPLLPPPVVDSLANPGKFKVPTRWYRWLDLFGILFFLLVYGANVFAMGSAPKAGPEKLSAGVLVISIAFQVFCMAVAIAIMIARVRPLTWLGLRWRQWPLVFLIAPVTVVVVWMFMGVLAGSGWNGWLERVLNAEPSQDSVKLLKESKDVVAVALMSIAAAIVAPLAEETIFRGYLYPVMKRFCGPIGAMIITSLIFATVHASAVALVPLFVLAMLLCLAYELTGSLWAPISIHFLFNSATVAIQLMIRAGWFELPSP